MFLESSSRDLIAKVIRAGSHDLKLTGIRAHLEQLRLAILEFDVIAARSVVRAANLEKSTGVVDDFDKSPGQGWQGRKAS